MKLYVETLVKIIGAKLEWKQDALNFLDGISSQQLKKTVRFESEPIE